MQRAAPYATSLRSNHAEAPGVLWPFKERWKHTGPRRPWPDHDRISRACVEPRSSICAATWSSAASDGNAAPIEIRRKDSTIELQGWCAAGRAGSPCLTSSRQCWSQHGSDLTPFSMPSDPKADNLRVAAGICGPPKRDLAAPRLTCSIGSLPFERTGDARGHTSCRGGQCTY